MTYQAPFGVWSSAKSFSEGEGPFLEIGGTRSEALKVVREKIRDGETPARLLLCSTNPKALGYHDHWIPMGYVTERDYETMSSKQRPRYLKERARALEALEEPRGAAPLEIVPPPLPEPEMTPNYVLNLAPNIVELLRDTFILVGQGHSVTVQMQAPEQQPQQAG